MKVGSPTKIDCLHRRRCSGGAVDALHSAPREKSNRCAWMEKRSSYSLLKIGLLALSHITSYNVSHLPNETKNSEKPARHACALSFFLDAAAHVGDKHAAAALASITAECARPDDATKPTPFTPPFSCFSFNKFY